MAEVAAAIPRLTAQIEDSQAEASQGVEDAIQRNQRATIDRLDDLIAAVRDQIAEFRTLGRRLTR